MKANPWLIWLTLLIAMILEMLPLPDWVLWLRPNWALLVLMFWALVWPQRIAIGYAFVIGIILDLINGTLLGTHALAMVPVIYILVKFHRQLMMFPKIQQMFFILILVIVYKLIIFILQGIFAEIPNNVLYWVAALLDMVLWPWIFTLLNDLKRRFYSQHS